MWFREVSLVLEFRSLAFQVWAYEFGSLGFSVLDSMLVGPMFLASDAYVLGDGMGTFALTCNTGTLTVSTLHITFRMDCPDVVLKTRLSGGYRIWHLS